MPKVHCDITTCNYCRKNGVTDFICGCDEIEMIDEQCNTFVAYVDMSPKYRETFWKRLASKKDKHECKKKSEKGKRYEMHGYVWFTENDDRWGTDEIWFTEQRSGMCCKGKDIERVIQVKEKWESVVPVADLPEAIEEDLYGK